MVMMMTSCSNKYVQEYFDLVESGKIIVCNKVRQNIELVKAKLNEDVYFEDEKIEKSIRAIEKYFFKLFPFQKYIIACIFLRYKADNKLVFKEFYLKLGRGNGKNGLISALAFILISNINNVMSYNVEIIANSEEQAMTSFEDVYNVIDDPHNAKLAKKFVYTKEKITFKKTRSRLKFYTSNPKTKDGGRPGCLIFDEIHAYESFKNIDVHTSGFGKKPDSRTFMITTDGNVRDGVLDSYDGEAACVLDGSIPNSRMFPFVCELDDPEEVDDPKMWEKPCPAINYLPELKQEMLDKYQSMQIRPHERNEFMTKRMNLPHRDEATAVAKWEDIEATNQEIPNLENYTAVGGIDYAEVRDFCAVGLLFKKDNKYIWLHHTFICSKSPNLKAIKFDIDLAIDKGIAEITNGNTIDPELVVCWFLNALKKYGIKRIAMDRFRYNVLKDTFNKYGIYPQDKEHPDGLLVLIGNGYITHNKVAPLIDEIFANHKIIYGDDPMMRWYTNNTYVDIDKKGNKSYKKIEPKLRKTDGFMALVAAISIENEIPFDTSGAELLGAITF